MKRTATLFVATLLATLAATATSASAQEKTESVAAAVAPVDATASLGGKTFFYIASPGTPSNPGGGHVGTSILAAQAPPGPHGPAAQAALFAVTPGDEPVMLHEGAPLVAPTGLAIDPDDRALYVADPAADALFVASSDGAAPVAIDATVGYHPRGVEVGDDGTIYFTGVDPHGAHHAGVFALDADLEHVRRAVKGHPLHAPAAVAVAASGDLWLTDVTSPGQASLVQVHQGVAHVVVAGLHVGDPAGVAVSTDGATVAVSGLSSTGHALVWLYDTASGALSSADQGISENTHSAGLHRAHDVDVFAWADRAVSGTVYRVVLQ